MPIDTTHSQSPSATSESSLIVDVGASLSRTWYMIALACAVGCGGKAAEVYVAPEAAADASAPAPSVVTTDSGVSIDVPTAVRLIQGRTTRVLVKVTRSGTPAPIELSVSGLPLGVTAATLQVPLERNGAELAIDVSAAAVQGTHAELTVTARTGNASASARLGVHVTGEPGSPDLSFGEDGMVTVNPPGVDNVADVIVSALAVRSDGKAIVVYNGNIVTLVDTSGSISTTFGTNGRADSSNRLGYSCSRDVQPCVILAPGLKTILVTRTALFQLSDLGEVDLGFGNAGRVSWPQDVWIWRASPAFIDGQLHLVGAGLPVDEYTKIPRLLRVAPTGTVDSRFNTVPSLDCSDSPTNPIACLFPAGLAVRPSGTVLYAGISGSAGRPEVRLAEFSTQGERLYTSPVLFSAELIMYPERAERRQSVVHALDGGSAAVVGLNSDSRLIAATVSSIGSIETAARAVAVERPSTACDSFGLLDNGGGKMTVYCTHDAYTELRLLRISSTLEPDLAFGADGIAIGSTRAAQAKVAAGVDDTIIVAAGRRLLRLWN